MSEKSFRTLTGLFFILGAVLVNIPYTLWIKNFDYPDILRMPTEEILTKFQAGGNSLIYTWLGWLASVIYLLAQTELFATVLPAFPSIDWAGFVGSLLWLLWMIVMGVYLVRAKEI